MRPYLPVVGAPQLRFQEFVPPQDVAGCPPAGAPPTPSVPASAPAPAPEKTKPGVERSPVTISPAAALPAAPVVAAKREASAVESTTAPSRAAAAQPPPILQDEVGRRVRPEDFLPYFPLAGSAAAGNDMSFVPPAPPTPGQLPPSTATYRQQ